jgi:hypothetical protein
MGLDPGGFWDSGRLRSYLVPDRCQCGVGQVPGPCRKERLVEWSAESRWAILTVTLSANGGTGFRFEYLNRTNRCIVPAGTVSVDDLSPYSLFDIGFKFYPAVGQFLADSIST